jgi:XTP/dITP diphosphohydrolase
MLTLLLTSPRVAPGLLSWQAWSALRSASRVLVGSAGHPQVSALTSAGVLPSVVDVPADDAAGLAELLTSAVSTASGGDIVWLAPPGESADAGLLSRLSDVPVQVLHGSADLPGAHLIDAVSVMDELRVSCPWDREQTHQSLLKYLLEEAYEAAEAIEMSDMSSLREELGDVLFQAVFHARVASERPAGEGGFTIDDVADVLTAKLRRRHPHVFGSVSVSSAAEVNSNWEEIKKAEKSERAVAAGSGPTSVLDGVPFGQPALSLAAQLQRRAERAGMPADEVSAGSDGEDPGADFGAELMRAVARARSAGVDPELALREAARRFADRFRDWERSRSND